MQPTSRSAVVRIAAGAAFVVAAILFVSVGLSIVFAVYAVSHPNDIMGVLVWLSFGLDIPIVALALGFVAGAQRLRRGDPRRLWQVCLGSGTACVVAAVIVSVQALVRGSPVDAVTLSGLLGSAVVLFVLAWLPTRAR
jgi:hypothetical protein